MTERERIRETDQRSAVGTYAAPTGATNVTVATPTDLVRWGPVIAGLCAALSTLTVLSVLGIAIGLTAFDPGDPAGAFGIGAGIWGAISALIAFAVGGWLAGRTAGVRGRNSGILNGAMVWFVTIPLLLYLLGAGIGALARTAGSAVGTAASVAGQAAAEQSDDPGAQATAQAAAGGAAGAVQATATALVGNVTPAQQEAAADTGGSAAWSTLLSLGLAAGAAIGGGYLGARGINRRTEVVAD